MLRHGWWFAIVFCLNSSLFAQPKDRVAESVALANHALARGQATEAVAILERQLQYAGGNPEFNDALRNAYRAELKSLTDPVAIERVKAKISLLGEPAELVTPPVPSPKSPVESSDSKGVDILKQATNLFNQATSTEPGKFITARDLFGLAFKNQVQMNADQMAAWAYCRVKVAADRLNKTDDAATASSVIAEVEEALATVPKHEGLRKTGDEILTLARKRGGTANKTSPGWQILETESFAVKYRNDRVAAENVAKQAEAKRQAIFTRWSGPPGGTWSPKCEIVLHADSTEFAKHTQMPATSTGRSEIKLDDGKVVSRRIDFRIDDTALLDDALPRELTHVILADLFPSKSPPKWIELGMCVLAASPTEVQRYHRTLNTVQRTGDLIAVNSVIAATEVPGQNATAFHVESVTLVDFLVRWQGDKAFTAFVRDAQRYGVEAGLKRQYGLSGIAQLETEWQRFALGK